MFRFLFRFTGLVLITLSFLFVVYDGTKSIADQTIYISRVGPTWVNIHPNSLSAFEPAVERLTGAWIWNDVIQPFFLEQPTALVLVIISALLILLGSKKTPRIGYRMQCRHRHRLLLSSPCSRSPSLSKARTDLTVTPDVIGARPNPQSTCLTQAEYRCSEDRKPRRSISWNRKLAGIRTAHGAPGILGHCWLQSMERPPPAM